MKKKLIPLTFTILIGNFLLILCVFFIPMMEEIFKGSILFLLPFAIYSLTGAFLVILTRKQKVKGKLKKYLLLTGTSAAGVFVGILLHNFLYALAVVTKNIVVLHFLMEILHAIFFITATIICPIGFLIGAIASLMLIIRKQKKLKKSVHQSF